MVDFKITESENWDRSLFKGKSISLSEFISKDSPLETVTVDNSVSLFSADISKHVILKVFSIKRSQQLV